MSWFEAAGFTSLAKSALKEAQKTIDKALDIQDIKTTGTCCSYFVPIILFQFLMHSKYNSEMKQIDYF